MHPEDDPRYSVTDERLIAATAAVFSRVAELVADARRAKDAPTDPLSGGWLMLESADDAEVTGKHIFIHYRPVQAEDDADEVQRISIGALNSSRSAEPAETIVAPENEELK